MTTNKQTFAQKIQEALRRARGVTTVARRQPSAGDNLIRQLVGEQREADQIQLNDFIQHGRKPKEGQENG